MKKNKFLIADRQGYCYITDENAGGLDISCDFSKLIPVYSIEINFLIARLNKKTALLEKIKQVKIPVESIPYNPPQSIKAVRLEKDFSIVDINIF